MMGSHGGEHGNQLCCPCPGHRLFKSCKAGDDVMHVRGDVMFFGTVSGDDVMHVGDDVMPFGTFSGDDVMLLGVLRGRCNAFLGRCNAFGDGFGGGTM